MMKVLKIIYYSLMGLCMGGLFSFMQLASFYVLFLSEKPYPIPMIIRIILYLLLLIMTLGWAIESIIKEIKEHNIIKLIEDMKRLERE